MTGPRRQRQPTFFWQGVFIMLPVVVLAVVSWTSLRRDEQAAEQAARRTAAANAQRLARAVRMVVDEELDRFLSLQHNWTLDLRLVGQTPADPESLPRALREMLDKERRRYFNLQHDWAQTAETIPAPKILDGKKDAEVSLWERDYAGFDLAEWAVPQAELLTDGRQLQPPVIPLVPRPPQWYLDLTPKQRDAWQRLRQFDGTHDARIQEIDEFMETEVSAEARRAARCLTLSPEELLQEAVLTETGISFQDIACYRLLLASTPRTSGGLLTTVWRRVFENPSFLAPALLALLEKHAVRAPLNNPFILRKVGMMRQYWNGQSKVRGWLEPLRQLPQLGNWEPSRNWAAWTGSEHGAALALFAPGAFGSGRTNTEGPPISERGYTIRFVPRPVLEAIFSRALTENSFLIPDYATAWVAVTGVPLSAADGERRGILAARQYVATAGVPLSAADRSGSFRIIERSAADRLEFPDRPESWEGKTLLGRARQKLGKDWVADAAEFELSFTLASRAQMLAAERRHGRLFTLLIAGTVLTALAGLLGAWRAFHQQLRLNELKSDFVASVSHELRAPIASVRLMGESLESGKVHEPRKQKEYFGFIVQECRRLTALIENVLDFSRIEQGRKEYEREPTDLQALTRETVGFMEPSAAEKGVRLALASSNPHSSTTGLELDVDGRAIQQALVNLIDNAIKHSPSGAEVIVGLDVAPVTSDQLSVSSDQLSVNSDQLTVTGHRSPVIGHLHLWVEDHGPGIPAAEHEKIFERFYRRGSELRRETQGVGIGLSIVKHVVEAHGGRVTVRSAAGEGSRFTLVLPLNTKNGRLAS